ncbi:hypothetical protein [Synechocystis sp. LKSZ1]|uniref:hypothetical protein n=1 Tax=Synechocystis sp. LKSZ1 TaxID=3144951 RepID=UPI00336C1B67
MFLPISTDTSLLNGPGGLMPPSRVAPEWEPLLHGLAEPKAPSLDPETRQQILLSLIFRLQRLRSLRRLPTRYDLSLKLAP